VYRKVKGFSSFLELLNALVFLGAGNLLYAPNSRLRKATAKALFSKNREISAAIRARVCGKNKQSYSITQLCSSFFADVDNFGVLAHIQYKDN